jgi:hypothetical protein
MLGIGYFLCPPSSCRRQELRVSTRRVYLDYETLTTYESTSGLHTIDPMRAGRSMLADMTAATVAGER